MADKLKKFLAKLTPKELNSVLATLLDIENNEIEHLDVKPLKGKKDTYRVRKGKLRIIFYAKDRDIRILSLSKRDEQTYRSF